MRKLTRQINIYIAAFLLTACAKPLLPVNDNPDRVTLKKTTLGDLNGEYEIMTIDTMMITLPSSFMNDRIYFDKLLPGKDDKVTLELISDNKIKMTLTHNGKVIKQKKLKFTLTGDYIEYNRSYISPFHLIFNGYTNSQVRIGLLKNGNLTVDMSSLGLLLLGFVPLTGAAGDDYNLIYAKKQ